MFAEGRKNANIFRETCSAKIREGFLKFWLSSEVLSKFSKPLRIKMKKTKKKQNKFETCGCVSRSNAHTYE